MEDKKYFKRMLIGIGILFFFTCFSIIYCFVNTSTVSDDQNASHIMSIVFLMLLLLAEAACFYYSFKAMVNGSSLLKAVMYVKDDIVNKKAKRNSLIFFIVSTAICLYMCLTLFPIDIFLSFFALGLRFALVNFLALVSIISISFFCYGKEKKE